MSELMGNLLDNQVLLQAMCYKLATVVCTQSYAFGGITSQGSMQAKDNIGVFHGPFQRPTQYIPCSHVNNGKQIGIFV